MDDPEWVDILDQISQALKDPFSSRVGLLLYRIAEEETKRQYIEKFVSDFLPWNPNNI